MSYTNEDPLFNTYSFNSESAYKANTEIPAFGIEIEDGIHKIIRNAKFLRVEINPENPLEKNICLEIPFSNGEKKELQISEEKYQNIINCVQNFNKQKLEVAVNSFQWDILHMDYAEKMEIDDCMFRMNDTVNFYHNFTVHCRNHEANSSEQAIRITEIMYERMAKREQEEFLKLKKHLIKKSKDKKAFEKRYISIFEKFSSLEKDISNDEIKNIASIQLKDITSKNLEKDTTCNSNNQKETNMNACITKWEYKIVNINKDGNIKTNYLGEILPKEKFAPDAVMTEDDWNLLGNAGWEATGNTFTSNGYTSSVLLKRPKYN